MVKFDVYWDVFKKYFFKEVKLASIAVVIYYIVCSLPFQI